MTHAELRTKIAGIIRDGVRDQYVDVADRVLSAGVRDQYVDVADRVLSAIDQAVTGLPEYPVLCEELSDYAHEAWSGWMEYLFQHSSPIFPDGSQGQPAMQIPAELTARWKRQLSTPYAELPENVKESDRKEADRMLAILRKHL